MKIKSRSTLCLRHWTRFICGIILCLALLPLSGRDDTGGQGTRGDYGKAFAYLNAQWQAGKVEEVIILHVPTQNDYPLEFTPDRLDSRAKYQVLVRNPQESEVMKASVAKILGMHPHFSGKAVPLRWGFLFLGSSDERLFSIYVDNKGKGGVLNGDYVTFDSDALFLWAEATFGVTLK